MHGDSTHEDFQVCYILLVLDYLVRNKMVTQATT